MNAYGGYGIRIFAFLMGWIIESKIKGYLLFSSFPLNKKDGLLLDVDDVECFIEYGRPEFG